MWYYDNHDVITTYFSMNFTCTCSWKNWPDKYKFKYQKYRKIQKNINSISTVKKEKSQLKDRNDWQLKWMTWVIP